MAAAVQTPASMSVAPAADFCGFSPELSPLPSSEAADDVSARAGDKRAKKAKKDKIDKETKKDKGHKDKKMDKKAGKKETKKDKGHKADDKSRNREKTPAPVRVPAGPGTPWFPQDLLSPKMPRIPTFVRAEPSSLPAGTPASSSMNATEKLAFEDLHDAVANMVQASRPPSSGRVMKITVKDDVHSISLRTSVTRFTGTKISPDTQMGRGAVLTDKFYRGEVSKKPAMHVKRE